PNFAVLAFNSLRVAAVTSLIAIGLGIGLVYALRLQRNRSTEGAVRTAGMGYAVPGMVVAVGVSIAMGWADRQLSDLVASFTGWRLGLLLSGTLFALIFAYLVRYLAVSLNTLEASLAKVTPGMDAAARSLGETSGG